MGLFRNFTEKHLRKYKMRPTAKCNRAQVKYKQYYSDGGKICLNYFGVLNCNIDTIAEAATAQIWQISTAPHIPFSPNPKNERR